MLEKTVESPLDCKGIQPVHSEGDQPWDFFGRNDAKAETPVLWPPHAKSWLIGKGSDAGRDWGQEEKGTTEDEMSGWHHWLDGRESEWTPGAGDGQGGLACWFMGSQRVWHDWATELNVKNYLKMILSKANIHTYKRFFFFPHLNLACNIYFCILNGQNANIWKLCLYVAPFNPHEHWNKVPHYPILTKEKLRNKQCKQLAQGHTVSMWWSLTVQF